ncbi:MAG: hypothetical protein ACFCU6_07265 [Balneolaceae bacterium]
MNILKHLFLLSSFLFLVQTVAFSQSTVVFNLNLEPELRDSVFVPGRDYVEITGNDYPFTKRNNRLADLSTPRDSIYSITLEFTRSDLNKTFNYNFVVFINGQPRSESMPRQITIQPGKYELDPFYFDAFAW